MCTVHPYMYMYIGISTCMYMYMWSTLFKRWVEHFAAVLPCHFKEQESRDVETCNGHRSWSFKLVKVTTVARDLL